MKKYFQNERKFPRRNLTRQKKFVVKMPCGKISGDEISSGKIGRNENIMRRNLNAAKISCGEISDGKISSGKNSCGEI